MKVTTGLLAATFVGLMLSQSALAGKVYKWVDSSGVTHYDEQAPSSGGAETLKTKETLPSDHEKALKGLELTKKKIADDQQTRLKKISDAEEKKKDQEAEQSQSGQCDTAKSNLQLLESKSRIRETSASGEVVAMTEEQRQAKMTKYRKYIEVYCSDLSASKKTKK